MGPDAGRGDLKGIWAISSIYVGNGPNAGGDLEIRTVSRFLPSKTAIETETSAEAIIAVLVRNYEVPANPDETSRRELRIWRA